jgi:hypothetical protein
VVSHTNSMINLKLNYDVTLYWYLDLFYFFWFRHVFYPYKNESTRVLDRRKSFPTFSNYRWVVQSNFHLYYFMIGYKFHIKWATEISLIHSLKVLCISWTWEIYIYIYMLLKSKYFSYYKEYITFLDTELKK